MKKLTACLFLLFVFFTTSAIDKYEAYILINKDTVFGYAVTNDLNSVHLKLNFEDSTGKVTAYAPGQIKRFGINVLDVWRKYVLLDLGVPTGPKDTGTTLVFGQALEEAGRVKLYKYESYQNKRNNSINPNLEIRGDRVLLEEWCLIKEEEILRLNRTSLIGNTRKELRKFFADCPAAVASVNSSRSTLSSIQALVRQYNRCADKKPSRP